LKRLSLDLQAKPSHENNLLLNRASDDFLSTDLLNKKYLEE
jgi:hypothetical protein